jgi:competence protein ComEA
MDALEQSALATLQSRAQAWRARLTPVRLIAGVIGVLAVAWAVWWLVRPGPPPVELSLPRVGEAPAAAVPTTLPPSTTAPAIVVQVAGAVQRPGVYRLPGGSRVIDLIDAAGGPTAEGVPDALGLAGPLADGQRVVVPTAGQVPPTSLVLAGVPSDLGGGAGGAPATPAGPLDLNQATAAQLEELPGIGPATAQAIVRHREANGPFRSVDALIEVRGIGPGKLEAIRDLVRV